MQELVYTSAAKGLKPGSRGYCTVASTAGMAKPLSERLESLGGYRHLYSPTDAQAALNPVAYSHLRTSIGPLNYHIVSRIADAGLDYSGRSNKIAHHLVLEPAELPESGPAACSLIHGVHFTAWSTDPKILPPRALQIPPNQALQQSATWQAIMGSSQWPKAVSEAVEHGDTVYLIFTPGMDVLGLITEVQSWLSPKDRWAMTYSTYFTKLPSGFTCQVRAVLADSPEATSIRPQSDSFVVDLRKPDSPRPRNVQSRLPPHASPRSVDSSDANCATSVTEQPDNDQELTLAPPQSAARPAQNGPPPVRRQKKQNHNFVHAALGICGGLLLAAIVWVGVTILQSPSLPPIPVAQSEQTPQASKLNPSSPKPTLTEQNPPTSLATVAQPSSVNPLPQDESAEPPRQAVMSPETSPAPSASATDPIAEAQPPNPAEVIQRLTKQVNRELQNSGGEGLTQETIEKVDDALQLLIENSDESSIPQLLRQIKLIDQQLFAYQPFSPDSTQIRLGFISNQPTARFAIRQHSESNTSKLSISEDGVVQISSILSPIPRPIGKIMQKENLLYLKEVDPIYLPNLQYAVLTSRQKDFSLQMLPPQLRTWKTMDDPPNLPNGSHHIELSPPVLLKQLQLDAWIEFSLADASKFMPLRPNDATSLNEGSLLHVVAELQPTDKANTPSQLVTSADVSVTWSLREPKKKEPSHGNRIPVSWPVAVDQANHFDLIMEGIGAQVSIPHHTNEAQPVQNSPEANAPNYLHDGTLNELHTQLSALSQSLLPDRNRILDEIERLKSLSQPFPSERINALGIDDRQQSVHLPAHKEIFAEIHRLLSQSEPRFIGLRSDDVVWSLTATVNFITEDGPLPLMIIRYQNSGVR